MTEVVVVGAAPAPDSEDFYRGLLASAAAVVAADAAGEWCASLGRLPDVVVGDFDSADPDELDGLERQGVRLEVHPADKDATDLELAVAVAQDLWTLPICLTAAFSQRLDHTLAALGLVMRAGKGARIAEPTWRAWPCSPGRPIQLTLTCGTSYSILALEHCEGVTELGGRWELREASMEALSGRGVSNEALGADVRVRVRRGSLVVIANDIVV